jgi:membrane associated rhomboid family serine protease
MEREPQEEPPGTLDRVVATLATVMDALGLNGTRLRWKWNQRRVRLAESGLRAEILWRSARGRHKMCPACRALVPRGAGHCAECGQTLASVRAPGFGRLISNVLPGATAATSLILLANGFWFLMTMLAYMQSGQSGGLFASFGGELIYRFGSGFSPATLSGEWWRIVTPIFLHGGIVHFFFNSYVLLQLGPVVEEEYGTERFWVAYLLCGLAGSAASQFVRPVNTVGASGALMGMMGLLLVHGWRTGGARGEALRQAMLRYAMYIVIFSLVVRGIDHLNHAGGFLCGAALGLVLPVGAFRGRSAAAAWQAAALIGVLLVVVSFYKVAAGAIA